MGNIISKVEDLHKAIIENNVEKIKEIMEDEKENDDPEKLESKERITQQLHGHHNALMLACVRESDPDTVVSWFVQKRRDFEEQINAEEPTFNMTPLHFAATRPNENAARIAYECILTQLFVRKMDEYNFDESKSKAAIRRVVSAKARFGWAPIHCAAYFYHPRTHDEMVPVLVLWGADPFQETHFGETPADLVRVTPEHSSLTAGHQPFEYNEGDMYLCKSVLAHRRWAMHGQVQLSYFTDRFPYSIKADSKRQQTIDDFVQACKYGDFDKLVGAYMEDKTARRRGQRQDITFEELMTAKNSYGNAAITVAASFGQNDVCAFLLSHCGNDSRTGKNKLLFFTTEEGWTPLLCAIKRRHVQTSRFFLEFESGKHALDQIKMKEKTQGFSPLHLAARDDNAGMIEMCLDHVPAHLHKQLLDERDNNGNNCLHLCFQPSQKNVFAEIAACGIPTCEGNTPLRDSVIHLVIARGLPFDAKTSPSEQLQEQGGEGSQHLCETADELARKYGATPALQAGLFAGSSHQVHDRCQQWYRGFRQQYESFCDREQRQEQERRKRESKKRLDQCLRREGDGRNEMMQEQTNKWDELMLQHPERERLDKLIAIREAMSHLEKFEDKAVRDEISQREEKARLSIIAGLQDIIRFEQEKITKQQELIDQEKVARREVYEDYELLFQQILIDEQAGLERIRRVRQQLLRDIEEFPDRELNQRYHMEAYEKRERDTIYNMMRQVFRNEQMRIDRMILEVQRREVDDRDMLVTGENNERQSLWYFHRELKHQENEEKKKKNPTHAGYYDQQFKQYQNTWQQQNTNMKLDDSLDLTNYLDQSEAVNAAGGAGMGLPDIRCFARGVPDLSTDDALRELMSLREVPPGRQDLKDQIPQPSDLHSLQVSLRSNIPRVKSRPQVQQLIARYHLTDDDIKALFLYKIENPYPVYKWLNGFLMGSRRGDIVKKKVGPFFVRLYRAMEKLPRVTVRANRAVRVKDIPALRRTFDGYKTVCKEGNHLSFWAFSSFSSEDSVISNAYFVGKPNEDAIIYSCGNLDGVDMQPFRPDSMANEKEILPLCPTVVEVQSCVKFGAKLMISVKQLPHADYAYLEPIHHHVH